MNSKSVCFILLKGLRFHAPVGVMSQETTVGNDISIDLRIGYPFQRAMSSDNLDDSLNYAQVYDIVAGEVREPVGMLERLAGKVTDKLFEVHPEITSIDIRIIKENPPMGADADGAGVEIHLINEKTEC